MKQKSQPKYEDKPRKDSIAVNGLQYNYTVRASRWVPFSPLIAPRYIEIDFKGKKIPSSHSPVNPDQYVRNNALRLEVVD